MKPPTPSHFFRGSSFVLTLLLLAGVLLLLLYQSCLPGMAQFSNDGPLGRHMSDCHRLPARYTGGWGDLNALGFREEAATPCLSTALLLLLGPVWFSKFYALLALLILGLSAWGFFRALGLVPWAATLGGLAVALNSTFFSSACWGVASHPLTVAMFFLALAALADTVSPRRWLRIMLAGFAVGMGICEGADIGAIYSLYVAAVVAFQTFFSGSGAEALRPKEILRGGGTLVLVALCAVLVAAQPLSELIATNIKGVVGTQQDKKTKAEHWDFATQWSLPKAEVLGLVVPGLFGYRMDTPDGGNYWGLMGRAPEWDRYVANGQTGTVPTGFKRYSGGGGYGGVLVVLLAVWAAAQSFRRQHSAFNVSQRRWIWFWSGLGVVSLLLAFGRFAPFYRFLYALPYFSTIRNPAKFVSLVSVALAVLFAYGVDGLWRMYLAADPEKGRSQLGGWRRFSNFDKKWLVGCLLVLGGSLLGWIVYDSHRDALIRYLSSVQIADSMLERIASFSMHQIGWFVLFLALGIFLMALISGRMFAKGQAVTGGILLGLLLVADLGRANRPWIVFYNHAQMYAADPITDLLKQKPFEQRVALVPLNLPPALAGLPQFYRQKWINLVFPFYNIQSYEVVQLPRVPEDFAAFEDALVPAQDADAGRVLVRNWQLTNIRYLVGPAMSPEAMNRQFHQVPPQFRIAERFEIVPEPGATQNATMDRMTAQASPRGRFALWEFSGALPRAKLYSRWQTETNDPAVLKQLTDTAFDPAQSVFVDNPLPAAAPTNADNANAGTVEFASYKSKEIVLNTLATNAAVLLLNDHYDANWKVSVDGTAGTLLRCNYIMRGVFLEPGNHTVNFRFEPPIWPLRVSLAGIGLGVMLWTVLLLGCARLSRDPVVAVKPPSPKRVSTRLQKKGAVSNAPVLK